MLSAKSICPLSGILCLFTIFAFSVVGQAVEINIGQGNTVRTGVIDGGDCVEGKGQPVREVRSLNQFSGITIDGAFDIAVVVQEGTSPSVTLNAQKELLPLIRTEVSGDSLQVYPVKSICSSRPIELTVAVSQLRRLQAIGASDISTVIEKSTLPEVSFDLKGTSTMVVKGTGADGADLKITESAEFDGRHFPVSIVNVIAGDTATVHVAAKHAITGVSKDASEIHVWGNPQRIKVAEDDAGELIMEE